MMTTKGTGRTNVLMDRFLQVVLLLCCLIHVSGEDIDDAVCDPEQEECLFENILTADLGSRTYLLDVDDSRKSFELLTKFWINIQNLCDGSNEIYYGIDMGSSSKLSKGRKGKGKGKCRGRNCPKVISYFYPDKRREEEMLLATDVCNVTLLEFLQDGNPDSFRELEEVQLNSENNEEEELQPFVCGDQCLQEREAVSALLTQCSNSDGSPVISDAVREEHICSWPYVTCDDELKVTQILSGSYDVQCGTIPTEIGFLSNLELLDLYDNGLTGPIPTDIGQLINLNTLWLNYNDLQCPLPEEVLCAKNIITLYTDCLLDGGIYRLISCRDPALLSAVLWNTFLLLYLIVIFGLPIGIFCYCSGS